MFVDKATVTVRAGRGGNGVVSFRHEKYVGRGGPDGGDGGKGGDVIFVADKGINTLLNFRYKQEIAAEDGTAGAKRKKHGKNGKDIIVKVPVGTIVVRDSAQIADLVQDGQQTVIAKGGRGGFGNAHFISSTRQAPRIAELGEEGESTELQLELKLLADVGLVGLPNAGKSTFLSVVTNAKPEIANYPFTTLSPNLGVARVDEDSLLLADIPGLIEGASQGKGLGDEFLRHVERTAVLVHLIDVYNNDVAAAYKTIRQELSAYSKALTKRHEIVALTKTEHLDEEIIEDRLQELRAVVDVKTPIMAISSLTRSGVVEVLRAARQAVDEVRAQEAAKQAEIEEAIPVIELPQQKSEEAYRVEKQDDGFVVTGKKIEGFAARTDFDNPAGVQRLRDIMRKTGVMHQLERMKIEAGDKIYIGKSFFEY